LALLERYLGPIERAAAALPADDPDKAALAALSALLSGRDDLTTGEAAAILGVNSINTVKNWFESGTIPGAYRSPGGHWKIPAESVAALAEYRLTQTRRAHSGSLAPARNPTRHARPTF
jgi:excisionase family DNA binding protein